MSDAGDNSTTGTGEQTQQNQGRWAAVKEKLSANMIDTVLWLTRLSTVVFCVGFVFPLYGVQASHYQKALISNAATSALRLHQHLPAFQFSREFFARLFIEDSCHYLFYSIIFMTSYPITMVLTPVLLFAILHSTRFSLQLLTLMGSGEAWVTRKLTTLVDANNQRNILRIVACSEIFVMLAIIFLMFTGRTSIILPFVYYRFLSLRYASQRNPYSRQMFYEFRVSIEVIVNKPACPQLIRTLAYKLIGVITRLAPQVAAPAQE
ncbi:PREDICTED: transmembrane protein 33-like [Priapulus caudatus]|uniref:Transmembrane protein 33-like n=1 Tax=Priapulus caudatus TaxID=37621 RepID=A0ABM1FBR0_PRICU|nr:PREDICTED: transmembrane protein 33-like [Priapulus caudatus]